MTYPPDRRTLRRLIEGLALFQDVLDDSIGRAVRTLAVEPAHAPAARLVSLLAEEAEFYPEEMVGDAWQNHLLDRVIAADNVFSRKAENEGVSAMGERLLAEVRRELGVLQQLYWQGTSVLAIEAHSPLGDERAPTWAGYRGLGRGPALHSPETLALKRELGDSNDWPGLLDRIAANYAKAGVGDFSRYAALRWVQNRDGHGRLEGVGHVDPVRLDDLVGYEREREPAVRNAERFAAGHPANNVLIYGEPGSGKSSTVKAILNAFRDRGLRLIDVPSEHLSELPQIIRQLRDRKQRFVVFVDDLAPEQRETWSKPLKAALDGTVEAKPENVVLYATLDRLEANDGESREDKLSLTDGFGLRLWFGPPDQDRYLAIVQALARRRELAISEHELRDRALGWAGQNGRSGRTARQFTDALAGELALP